MDAENAAVAAAVEVAAQSETDQAETRAETAVEVAQIEAERDVKIAEVHAEAHVAEVEANAEAREAEAEAVAEVAQNQNGELQECQRQITALTETVATLAGDVSSILQRLTPVASDPPNPQPEPESSAAMPENPVVPEAVETPPAEPSKKVRPHRWI